MKPTPPRTFFISLDPDEMLTALAANLIDSPAQISAVATAVPAGCFWAISAGKLGSFFSR